MTKQKATLKSNAVAPSNGQQDLVKQAIELDQQIRAELRAAHGSLTNAGRLITRMQDSELWKYLPGRYRGWEDYVNLALGPRARSSLHEIVAAYSLTEGSHPIPPEVVNKMGIKRAAQLARLKPEQRTPAIIHAATMQKVTVFKNAVQAKLNEDLPPDEQRELTQLFSINLPQSTIEAVEEYLEVAIWMEGVRDGDSTVTMRQKAFGMLVVAANEYFAQELAQALQYRKALEAKENGTAQAAETDASEEEDEADFPDDEHVHL